MSKEWKPPRGDAEVFAQYKAHVEGERKLKPKMEEAADRALATGATVGQLARQTGLTPEVFRRRARRLGIEHKRAPTVGKLADAPVQAESRPAVATPRVRVSAVVPSEPPPEAEPTAPTAEAPLPLPTMTEGRFRRVIALAQSRATPDQRERLNRTAKVSEQLGRDAHNEVLTAAFEMGLLKHDEVYAEPERPAGSEETSG